MASFCNAPVFDVIVCGYRDTLLKGIKTQNIIFSLSPTKEMYVYEDRVQTRLSSASSYLLLLVKSFHCFLILKIEVTSDLTQFFKYQMREYADEKA